MNNREIARKLALLLQSLANEAKNASQYENPEIELEQIAAQLKLVSTKLNEML